MITAFDLSWLGNVGCICPVHSTYDLLELTTEFIAHGDGFLEAVDDYDHPHRFGAVQAVSQLLASCNAECARKFGAFCWEDRNELFWRTTPAWAVTRLREWLPVVKSLRDVVERLISWSIDDSDVPSFGIVMPKKVPLLLAAQWEFESLLADVDVAAPYAGGTWGISATGELRMEGLSPCVQCEVATPHTHVLWAFGNSVAVNGLDELMAWSRTSMSTFPSLKAAKEKGKLAYR